MNRKIALVLFGSLVMAFQVAVAATQPLSFDARVKAQEAIERVYYNHRIWPKENPTPKPPFKQMVSRTMLEAKVTDYLKKSAALDEFWQRPISAEQLQAEMDRMAKGTKDPATLKELFAALNNDPYLIAECLARHVFADRLIRNWYANDERFHGETKAKAEAALASAGGESLSLCSDGEYQKVAYILSGSEEKTFWSDRTPRGEIALDQKRFQKQLAESPEEGKPAALRETPEAFVLIRTTLRTPNRMEVETVSFSKRSLEDWLKTVEPTERLEMGASAAYGFAIPVIAANACGEGWYNGILDDALAPRLAFRVIWTGTEMIVWGGLDFDLALNTGARYNPATDSWRQVPLGANCPSGRYSHTAVWTGTEMIVWGGVTNNSSSVTNTGGRFNPATESWTPTSTGASCPAGRRNHIAVWTGAEMIVWGGYGAAAYNSGGRYAPATDTWTPTSVDANTPCYRMQESAIWTGAEMIVWGGSDGNWSASYRTGGRYNPTTDTWLQTSLGANCPSPRRSHSAVWTGMEMIIWGGVTDTGGVTNAGARYNPASDTWTLMSTGAGCPSGRHDPAMIWTGTEAILWGGDLSYNAPVTTGARYRPSTDSWAAIATGTDWPWVDPLKCSAVWTGTEMIVWGAKASDSLDANAGGRYNPSTDSWTRVPPIYAPKGRSSHTAVWTGAEMIVWGGSTSSGPTTTGARYTPASDSWTATPDLYTPPPAGTNCPSARDMHVAVWDGTEMIVWGGAWTSGSSTSYLNTGGRYNPTSNTWLTTSTGAGVPAARSAHTAVWTGTEMIIWGGMDATYLYSSGGRYNPSSDTWAVTSTGTNCPSARNYHSAIWTGTEMIIWGGFGASSNCFNTGGRYDPVSDTWRPTSTGAGVPSARLLHSAVWTGAEIVVWGGDFFDGANHRLNTGGRYNPSNDLWSPASTGTGTPSARSDHSAVWRGTDMIVWGGWDGSSEFNSGSQYHPSSDTWSPTSTGANCPSARADHTAVWTGTAMIVWGGYDGDSYLNTGGQYFLTHLPYEVPNTSLAWSGKDGISWSAADCATAYRVYRGNPSDLANLPTGAQACRSYDGAGTTTGATQTAVPSAGSFYWYLAVGYDSAGEGSAGSGTSTARMISSSGTCP